MPLSRQRMRFSFKKFFLSFFVFLFVVWVFKTFVEVIPTSEQWFSILDKKRIPGIAAIVFSCFFATFLRGIRWKILTNATGLVNSIRAILIHGWTNLLANYSPFRVGESVKAITSKELTGSISYAGGLVVLERFYDIAALLLLFCIVLIHNEVPAQFEDIIFIFRFAAPLVTAVFILLPLLIALKVEYFPALSTQEPRRYKILRNLIQGVISVGSFGRHLGLIVGSMIIFLIMALGYIIYFRTYAPEIHILSGITVLVLVNLSAITNVAPLNIGVFEFAASSALVMYSIPLKDGLVFAVGLHFWVILFFTVAGFSCKVGLFYLEKWYSRVSLHNTL